MTVNSFRTLETGSVRGAWLESEHGMMCVVDQNQSQRQQYVAVYPGRSGEDLTKNGQLPVALTFSDTGELMLQIPQKNIGLRFASVAQIERALNLCDALMGYIETVQKFAEASRGEAVHAALPVRQSKMD